MSRIFICLLLCLATLGFAQAQQGPFHFSKDISSKDYVPGVIVYKLKPDATQAPTYGRNTTLNYHQPKILEDLKANTPTEMYPHGLVKNAAVKNQALVKGELANNGSTTLSGIYTIKIPLVMNLAQAITELRQQPNVMYAEPSYTFQSLKVKKKNKKPFLTPNDPDLATQYYLDKIKAKEAWDVQTGSASMIIGVVDFGFDATANHNDLLANRNPNYYDIVSFDQDLSYPANPPDNDNDYQHGTEVVGVCSAVPNNSTNIAGTGYNCQFLAVKAANNDGVLGFPAGYDAIVYAAQNGAKVINLSWGRPGNPSRYELDLLKDVVDRYDVVLVAAAGQTGTGGIEQYWYPASYSEIVLSVTGSDENDEKFNLVDFNERVDLIAPGKDISTLKNSNGSGNASGTSFSAPMVAGAAALVRVQFPSLNASQVIARLKATANANAIYGLAANSAYIGKLGTGLLDMHQALVAVDPQFISLESHQLDIPSTRPGSSTQLRLNLTNQLAPFTNLQLELSTSSAFVTIDQNTANIGAVATSEVTSNQTTPFRITIAAGTPSDERAFFTLTVKDNGTTIHTIYFYETLNPTFSAGNLINFGVNNISMTMNDVGRLGVRDDISSTNQIGLVYNGKQILSESGLLVGINNTQVSNTVKRDEFFSSITRDKKFTAKQSSVQFTTNDDTSQDITFSYEDITDNAERIQVEVTQRTRAWRGSEQNNFVIIEYKIRNISGATISDLYAGIFADWNIDGINRDNVSWDATNRFGYASKGNTYAGIKLLTAQTNTHYAIDVNGGGGSVSILGGYSTDEKFTTLSNTDLSTNSSHTNVDAAHVVGAHLTNLGNNETQEVAFAVMVADNLTNLRQVATNAVAQFQSIKTSPVPDISNPTVCRGSAISLSPTNGSNFDFFADKSQSILLSSGRSLALNNITVNDTFYVINKDSLWASAAKEVIVTVNNDPRAQFTNDQAVPMTNAAITFTDQSTGAIQWEWDFGNGQTFTGQTPPAQTYTSPASYPVKLKVTSSGGCVDSLIQTIDVIDCSTWTDAIVMDTETLDIGTTKTLRFSNTATDAVSYQWDFGNGNTSTLANPLQLFNETGTFTITLTTKNSQGCSITVQRTLTVINSFVVGVNEELKQQISVYPNPGKQQFQLQLPTLPAPARLQLTNLQGQIVFEKATLPRSQQAIKLDLPKLPTGVYLLQVKWGDNTWSTRLTIQND